MARRGFAVSSVLLVVSAFVACAAAADGAMLGGKKSGDVASEEVQKAAQEAVALLNHGEAQKLQGAPLNGLLQLAKIKDVQTQVVAGVNYFFTLTVKDASGKEHDLELTLWSRPWLAARNDVKDPAYQLTSVKRVSESA